MVHNRWANPSKQNIFLSYRCFCKLFLAFKLLFMWWRNNVIRDENFIRKNYARCVNLLSVRFTVHSPSPCNCDANSSAHLAEPGSWAGVDEDLWGLRRQEGWPGRAEGTCGTGPRMKDGQDGRAAASWGFQTRAEKPRPSTVSGNARLLQPARELPHCIFVIIAKTSVTNC